MRRKFKKTVTMLASLTISVAQLQTPAMADVSVEKKTIEAGQTEENNSSVIDKNNGTVKNNNNGGVIESNNNLVENNNKGGVIEKNNKDATVKNNNTDAQVKENYGTIETNEGIVGGEGPGNTANYGIIKDNQADIYLNAGADDGKELGLENYEGATIESNSAVISVNNGTITKNEDTGEILENNNLVGNNQGSIDENHGIVSTNESNINYNDGSVSENLGYIEENDEEGYVGSNHGEISNNNEGAKVGLNTGFIENNEGVVGFVEEVSSDDGPSDHGNENQYYVDQYTGNYGTIENNEGTITYNAGLKDKEKLIELDAPEDVKNNFGGGIVEVNEGLIIENSGTVDANSGTVKTNLTGGIVGNYKDGVVEKNDGKVYNYGGVVKNKSTGTEYFSVSITTGANSTQKGGKNLTEYEDSMWLGQQGTKQSTSEITVTPSKGFYISGIDVPTSISKYVSVKDNPDGTWTITITSGINIMLSLPDAVLRYSDNNSGSGNEGDSNNQNGNKNNVTVDLRVILDSKGNTLNLDLTNVFKPIKDEAAALNLFDNLQVSTNEIMGFGTLDITKLFKNTTETSLTIPVSAKVTLGNKYLVHLTTGKTLEIECTQEGVLNIQFEKGDKDVSFIICEQPKTPEIAYDDLTNSPSQEQSAPDFREEIHAIEKKLTELPSGVTTVQNISFGDGAVSLTGSDILPGGADTVVSGEWSNSINISPQQDANIAGTEGQAQNASISDNNAQNMKLPSGADSLIGYNSQQALNAGVNETNTAQQTALVNQIYNTGTVSIDTHGAAAFETGIDQQTVSVSQTSGDNEQQAQNLTANGIDEILQKSPNGHRFPHLPSAVPRKDW